MLTTRVNNKTVDRRVGSLLWTHFGVSGPVTLDASRFWILANQQGQAVQLHLNCFPQSTSQEIEQWLIRATAAPGRKTVESFLADRLPARLATHLAQFSKIGKADSPVNLLSKDSRRTLVKVLTNLPLPVNGIPWLELCRSHGQAASRSQKSNPIQWNPKLFPVYILRERCLIAMDELVVLTFNGPGPPVISPVSMRPKNKNKSNRPSLKANS